jgi:hypothetical protein
MRSAASFYRTLLWCYPAPFRKEYGGQMVEAFSDQMREARAHGGWRAQAGMLARTCPISASLHRGSIIT